jgi:hypothetical protein
MKSEQAILPNPCLEEEEEEEEEEDVLFGSLFLTRGTKFYTHIKQRRVLYVVNCCIEHS